MISSSWSRRCTGESEGQLPYTAGPIRGVGRSCRLRGAGPARCRTARRSKRGEEAARCDEGVADGGVGGGVDRGVPAGHEGRGRSRQGRLARRRGPWPRIANRAPPSPANEERRDEIGPRRTVTRHPRPRSAATSLRTTWSRSARSGATQFSGGWACGGLQALDRGVVAWSAVVQGWASGQRSPPGRRSGSAGAGDPPGAGPSHGVAPAAGERRRDLEHIRRVRAAARCPLSSRWSAMTGGELSWVGTSSSFRSRGEFRRTRRRWEGRASE